jgi:hypothetical protein
MRHSSCRWLCQLGLKRWHAKRACLQLGGVEAVLLDDDGLLIPCAKEAAEGLALQVHEGALLAALDVAEGAVQDPEDALREKSASTPHSAKDIAEHLKRRGQRLLVEVEGEAVERAVPLGVVVKVAGRTHGDHPAADIIAIGLDHAGARKNLAGRKIYRPLPKKKPK